MSQTIKIALVGGGLAGCECALQLADAGHTVTLFEQRPLITTPAHESGELAELVCSNSFRSNDIASGVGLLKEEMRDLGSPIMALAETHQVPAGKALAVDRLLFAKAVTKRITEHPHITLIRQEITSLDAEELAPFTHRILATGPLTSPALSASLAAHIGTSQLYFYDAIAPIIAGDSINMEIAFWGSRYGEIGEGDYLNCPLNQEEYTRFFEALCTGERVKSHNFEQETHFEGCMPIEALADRGVQTLTFGPMKPVGFTDPRTGSRPYAILQLRKENHNATMFNLVGCQTKLTYPAQKLAFQLIPGLEQVEFLRYGSMHRNTYLNAPQVLNADLSLRMRPDTFIVGQLTGVEGYVESAACGLWLGKLLVARLAGNDLPPPPNTTALGALLEHLRTAPLPKKTFQPSNVHFGLMPPPHLRVKKKERKAWYAERAREAFTVWQASMYL